jgi:hypothetical protein
LKRWSRWIDQRNRFEGQMGGANERDELEESIVEMDWKNGFEGWIGGADKMDLIDGLY